MGDKKRSGRRKKRQLGGVCAKQTNQDGSPHGLNVDNDLNVSASSRKLDGGLKGSDIDPNTVQTFQEGFILLDVDILVDFLSRTVLCTECTCSVQCYVEVDSSQGFAHDIVARCEACHSEQLLFTTSKRCMNTDVVRGKKTPMEVNARMVAFTRAIGKGHTALEVFAKYLNSPQALAYTSYKKLFMKQLAAAKTVAVDSMKAAAAEVKAKKGEDVPVSVDWTWQRLGHISHHGVVTAISVDIGKCVDVEVLSNICKGCRYWEKRDKTSKAYRLWRLDHKCSSNHTGSAGAMEAVGSVRMFSRSEDTRGLRYTAHLGDGDFSSFKKVCEAQPYGDIEVNKLECVGHVQKRVGSRLRKLRTQYKSQKLSDGKGISGAGRLTEQRIDTLQNYFGFAIRQNSGNLIEMQRAVLASLYHVGSTDESPKHDMCPTGEDSWCKYLQDPAGYDHKHGLPECIIELIEPIYNELSDPSLLAKCLHGKTQNNNECLNKLVWDRCCKEVFVGSDVIQEAVYSAVSSFNDGNVAVIRHLELLGIKPGYFISERAASLDARRINRADTKNTDAAKKRRKVIRAQKKGFQDKKTQEEGNVYEAGGH